MNNRKKYEEILKSVWNTHSIDTDTLNTLEDLDAKVANLDFIIREMKEFVCDLKEQKNEVNERIADMWIKTLTFVEKKEEYQKQIDKILGRR